MARDPEAMIASRARRLRETTGRSLEEWTALLPDGSFSERQRFLVERHGFAPREAKELVHIADYRSRPPDDEMVEAQYGGAKAALRPVYDAIVEAVRGFGDDVSVAPRRTYVTLARGRQFAVVQASTRTRVDLGLRLDDPPSSGRLVPAGSFGSGGISHRVALTAAADVDDELRGWLRAAYDGAAPTP
jgi:Domain of unknown function (DUF5655)